MTPDGRALLAALVAAEHRAAVLGPPVTGWADLARLAEHHRLITWDQAPGLAAAIPLLERWGLIEVEHVPVLTRRGIRDVPWMHIGREGATVAAESHALALLRPIGDSEVRWLCTCGAEGTATDEPAARAGHADHERKEG